jgi:integrase
MADEKIKRTTKRRGNGEGSIFQRADGRWVATIAVGYDHAGKRRRKTVYGHTKREVQDELNRLQQRKSTGALTATSKVTVAQYLDRWLQDVARLTVRNSTFRRYSELLKLHVKPRIGGVRLHRLTAGDVQAIYSEMEGAGLSPRTRQFVHTVLRKALDNAVRWGLVIRNVCAQVTPPRVPKATMQVLTPSQASAFLKAAEGDRLYAMYVLALAVGMRQGELMGLQWPDVDLDAGWLSIAHTLADDGTLGEPKTTKSRRRIELPAIAVEALWSHKRQSLAEGIAGSPFVFCDSQGGPLRRQNVQRRSFRSILKAAELPTIRFHDLRHTAATLMLTDGIHPKVVQEVLGHATIAITLDTYSHVLPSMQRDAADRMNRMLKKVGTG